MSEFTYASTNDASSHRLREQNRLSQAHRIMIERWGKANSLVLPGLDQNDIA